ncbi:MAG: tetratricopeptide repeat protein [Bacteroidales bacterium]|nr:tetratricopeptide repeat protein [Bacteroidales bacterium]
MFCSTIAWGQTDHTDSILSAISGLSPVEQTDTLNALSVFYAGNSQYYQAKRLAEEALSLAEIHSFSKGKCEALKNIAESYWGLKDYLSAIPYYNQAAELYKDLNDRVEESFCLNAIGASYRRLSKFDKALEFHLKSLSIAERINNEQRVAIASYSVAYIYHVLHNYPKALEYYFKSLEMNQSSGDASGIADDLNNIGAVYFECKEYDKSLEYYTKAMASYRQVSDSAGIARTLCNIGNIYLLKGEIYKALEYHQKSLRLEEECNNTEGIAYSYSNIAEIYRQSGDIAKAVGFKERALTLSNDLEFKQRVCDSLRVIHEQSKNFQKALSYSLQSSAYKDSVLNSESQQQILELQTKYETEKKENQIENLNKENLIKVLEAGKQKTHKNYIIILSIILVILIATWFSLYRLKQLNYRNELKKKNLAIEKDLLMAQINPHFIFNSLNSVQGFIGENDTLSAQRYLSKFAKLIRLNLENSRSPYISLKNEYHSLQLFLELEQIRFDNKFDFIIAIPGEINQEQVQIPPMLIQPFVENAIIHGIMHLNEKGFIKINFLMDNNFLFCSVEDNGIGREKSAGITIRKDHQSLGLKLIDERIELLKDQNKSPISVNVQDLVSESGATRGTLVKLIIPITEDI